MYKDRGIIKWAPFDALVGFQSKIDGLLYERGKRDKPILCEDKLAEMDLTIQKALTNNEEVLVSYYQDGYVKNTYGLINKVNKFEEIIEITKLPIKTKDILSVEIFE